MTSNRSTQIGIDRLVRLAWLERTSSLVLAGNTPAEIKTALQHDLCDAFQSRMTETRGSLSKTVTILMKVWLTTPRELSDLRVAGLKFLKRLPTQDRKIIHWGMVMAVYPFWASVASQVGRLLRLQGNVVAVQVQRRMREQYGERETVSRRTRYVLRGFVDWGTLRETECAGVYEPLPAMVVLDRDVVAWMIEAVVLSRANGPMTLRRLMESTSLFPFKAVQISADELLSVSSRLDVIRHNLDEELVVLKAADHANARTPDIKKMD